MREDCRRRGEGAGMAEREAERPRRALGGRLGMGMLAWDDDAVDELCNQLMCEGRL